MTRSRKTAKIRITEYTEALGYRLLFKTYNVASDSAQLKIKKWLMDEDNVLSKTLPHFFRIPIGLKTFNDEILSDYLECAHTGGKCFKANFSSSLEQGWQLPVWDERVCTLSLGRICRDLECKGRKTGWSIEFRMGKKSRPDPSCTWRFREDFRLKLKRCICQKMKKKNPSNSFFLITILNLRVQVGCND